MSMQEWSNDYQVSVEVRDEIILNQSRSLWNLHMTRHYIKGMEYENKLLNLASVPRSTKIITSHWHATTTKEDDLKGTIVPPTDEITGTVVPNADEMKGTMIPNIEVNVAIGLNKRSVEDAFYLWSETVLRIICVILRSLLLIYMLVLSEITSQNRTHLLYDWSQPLIAKNQMQEHILAWND